MADITWVRVTGPWYRRLRYMCNVCIDGDEEVRGIRIDGRSSPSPVVTQCGIWFGFEQEKKMLFGIVTSLASASCHRE